MEGQDRLKGFYEVLRNSPGISGIPDDYNVFRSVLSDQSKAKGFYDSLKNSGNISGLPDDFGVFSSCLGVGDTAVKQEPERKVKGVADYLLRDGAAKWDGSGIDLDAFKLESLRDGMKNQPRHSLEGLKTEVAALDSDNKAFLDEWESKQKERDVINQDPSKALDYLNYARQNYGRYNDIRAKREKLMKEIDTHPDKLSEQKLLENTVRERVGHSKSIAEKLKDDFHNMPFSWKKLGDEGKSILTESDRFSIARDLYEKANDVISAPSKHEGSNGFANFMKGAGNTFGDKDFWTLGLTGIMRDIDVAGVVKKLQSNTSGDDVDKILSPGEQEILAAFTSLGLAQANRANDLSLGYMAGGGAAESLGFMAEFLATGGVAKAASKAATNAVSKWLVRQTASNGLMRELGKGLVWGTKAGIETAARTPLMPSTYKNITGRLVEPDENGHIGLTSGMEAVGMGIADSFIENLSELSGAHLAGIFGTAGKGIGKLLPKQITDSFVKVGDKLASSKAGDMWRVMNGSDVSRFLKQTGYNGVTEEWGEEWYGAMLRNVTIDPDALKDYAKTDNQLVTISSFLPMAIVGGGVSAGMNMRNAGRYKKSIETLEGMLSDLYTPEQMDYLKGRIEGADNRSVSQLLTPIVNEAANASPEHGREVFKAVSDFMYARSMYHVSNGAYGERVNEMKVQADNRMTEETGGYVNGTTGNVDMVGSPEGRTGYIVGETGDGAHKMYMVSVGGEKIPVSHKDFFDDGGWSMVETLDKDAFLDRIVLEREKASEEVVQPVVGGEAILDGERVKVQRVEGDGSVIVEKADGTAERVDGGILSYDNSSMSGGENAEQSRATGETLPTQQPAESGIATTYSPGGKSENAVAVEPERLSENPSGMTENGNVEQSGPQQSVIPQTKEGRPDYNAMLESDPALFASEWEKRSNPEDTKKRLSGVSEKLSGKIESLVKKSDTETDFNKISDIEDEIVRLRAYKDRIDGVVAERYTQKVEEAGVPETAETVTVEKNVPMEATPEDAGTQESVPDESLSGDGGSANTGGIEPVGRGFFGNIYDQFRGKAKEAVDFLLGRQEGDAVGVFHRDDLGDIDVVWGDEKSGLAHIIDKHVNKQNDFSSVDEAVSVIEDVVTNGLISRENSDKIILDRSGYRVVIGKRIRNGAGEILESKNWVVTSFDKSRSKKEKTLSGETLTTPLSDPKADRVTLPSNSVSANKDTDIPAENQVIGAENPKDESVSDRVDTETVPESVAASVAGMEGESKQFVQFRYMDGSIHFGEVTGSEKGRVVIKEDGGRIFRVHPDRILANYGSEAELQKAVGEAETGADGLRFREVYHGSPHDFDKFSVEKINTGEGNQSFGWGLYFTEKEDLAKWYADKLVQGGVSMTSSSLGKPEFDAMKRIDDAYEYDKRIKTFDSAKSKAKKELSEAIAKADRDFKETGFHASEKVLDFLQQAYNYLETVDETNYKNPKLRNLYNVEIPDAGFLNWDKQLTDLQKRQISDTAEAEDILFSFYGDKVSPAEYFRKAINVEGFQVYKMLSDVLHGDKKASMFLNRAGFNGIEYIAQRHTTANKTGAMNYVVFDDNAVEMIDHIRYRNENTLEVVNARFNEELQQQIDGKLSKGHVYRLGKPSKVLLSAGIPDLPIELGAERLAMKASMEYESNHPFELKNVENLPDAISHPIAVFESTKGEKANVILTELRQGKNHFVVILKVQNKGAGRGNVQINDIRSLYPKDNKIGVIDWINGGLAKWVDKEKVAKFISVQWPYYIGNGNKNSNIISVTNIIKNFQNPTLLEGEISSAIDTLSEELGVKVNKVSDRKDLTEGIKDQLKNARFSGLYDPATGEVSVVMNEIGSVAEAQATVLHEVLGHKGIRGLFGDRLADFCGRVLKSLHEKDRAELIEKYDGNEQLAAEEYVAGFAEGYSDPSTWEKVKAVVKEFLREMGIELHLSDNDLKYLLWKAKNGLKEGDGFVDVMNKTAKDREVQGVLFRKNEYLQSASEFITKKRVFAGNMRERFVDSAKSVKDLTDFLKGRGIKIRDFEDAYSESLLSESKSHHAIQRYQQNVQKPLNEAIVAVMQSSGTTFSDVCHYVIAKHAPERNREIGNREYQKWLDKNRHEASSAQKEYDFFKKNGSKPDAEYEKKQKAFEELASRRREKFDTQRAEIEAACHSGVYSGLSDKEAGDIVSAFEGKCSKKDIDLLWERINAATKFALEVQYKNGFISKGLSDHLSGMFKYYVPLKGWEESDGVDYSQSERFSNQSSGKAKKAKGRKTMADNPFSYIEMAAEEAVRNGNRNHVRQCLYNMCVNNPDKSLYTVSKTYYVEKNGEWEATDERPEELLFTIGKAKTELIDTPHKDFIKSADEKRYDVDVWVGGEKRTITFAQGEKGLDIADAINRERVAKPGRVSNAFGAVTRYLASINTSKNPEFILRNFERDFLYAVPAYAIKGGHSFKLMGNLPKAFKALNAEFVNGDGKKDTELNRYMDEYLNSGGKTGFVHSLDIESRKRNAEREIKRMMGSGMAAGKARAVGRAMGATMEYLSDMSENSIRFAVFLTEREKGVSIKEAAVAAKEITVNFNRKGTLTPVMGSYFAFFNASVQGSMYNFVNLGVKWTNRFIIANAVLGAVQMISASLSRCFGDDDELGVSDYDRLSDYTRNNNIILPDILRLGELFGWQNEEGRKYGFMTVPMPQSFRAVSSIGIIADQMVRGNKDVSKGMMEIVDNAVANMSPLDLEFYNFSTGNPSMFLARALPTVVQPFVDIVANKDFADRQIYREEFMKNQEGKVPESSLGLSRTNGVFTAIARWGNRMANGTTDLNPELQVADSGRVSRNKFMSWLDWNPAVMEHVFEGLTGGRGRFWNNVYKTVEAGLTEKEVDNSDIPFVRTHRTMPYRKTHWEMYFDLRDQVSDVDFVAGVNKKAGNYGTHVKVLTNGDQLNNKVRFEVIDGLVGTYRTLANRVDTPELRDEYLEIADKAVLEWAKGLKKAGENNKTGK